MEGCGVAWNGAESAAGSSAPAKERGAADASGAQPSFGTSADATVRQQEEEGQTKVDLGRQVGAEVAAAAPAAPQHALLLTTEALAVCDKSRPGEEARAAASPAAPGCGEKICAAASAVVAAPDRETAHTSGADVASSDSDTLGTSVQLPARDELSATLAAPVPQDCGSDAATAPSGTAGTELPTAKQNATAAHADANVEVRADETVGDTPARETDVAAGQESKSTPQVQLAAAPSLGISYDSLGYQCEYCGTIAKVRFGAGRFCSRQCGARFSRSLGTQRAASAQEDRSEQKFSRLKTANASSAGAARTRRGARHDDRYRTTKPMSTDTMKRCKAVLNSLLDKADAKPFCVRIDPEEYPDYTNFVSEPMDLSIVSTKLKSGEYRTVSEFARQTRLVFQNCHSFNHDRSPICKTAHRLLAMFERLLRSWVTSTEPVATELLDDGLCMACGTEDLKDHASMLLCDGCDAAYHMSCLSPPLSTVPLVDWFCPDCAETQAPPEASVTPSRTLRSSVCDRTDVERKALDRWLREHVGAPVMLENGSVGILQGFKFGYCQIDTGGVQPTTKSPHEVSLNQAGLVIDYEESITQPRTDPRRTASSKEKRKGPARKPVVDPTTNSSSTAADAPSSSQAPEVETRKTRRTVAAVTVPTNSSSTAAGSPSSSQASAVETRKTRRTVAAATVPASTSPKVSPSADRTDAGDEDSSERPKSMWVCVNCLKQNVWNARKCSGCSELKGHTASDIATLNRSGYQESTPIDRDVPAFLLARFATAVGFDRRMLSHKGIHDHAFCATPTRSGRSPSSQSGASRRIKSARINTCGHPERRHHAKGLCMKCYGAERKRKDGLLCKALPDSNPADTNVSVHTAAEDEYGGATEHQQTTSPALLAGQTSTNTCGHPERRHHAKGLCMKCYGAERKRKRKDGLLCKALPDSNPADTNVSVHTAAEGEYGGATEHQQTTSPALLAGQTSTTEPRSGAPDKGLDTQHGCKSQASSASSHADLSDSIESVARSASEVGSDDPAKVILNSKDANAHAPVQDNVVGTSQSDQIFRVPNPPSSASTCHTNGTQLQSLDLLEPKAETMYDDGAALPKGDTESCRDPSQAQTASGKMQELDVDVARLTRSSFQETVAGDTERVTSVLDPEPGDTEVLPERPDRLLCMYNHLRANAALEGTVAVAGRESTMEELLYVHTAEYIQMVLDLGKDAAAKDTPVAAKLAVGTTTDTVSAVVVGHHDTGLQHEQVQNGMAVVRPPGHHAGPNAAQGWCYFNNIAIAARAAQRSHGVRRVLIIDWDVHHGNGTEEIFYKDATVLTVSIHRKAKDFYPESGSPNEVGEGQGLGFNCNIAWSKDGMGDAEYLMAFSRIVLPLAYEFSPELVLVSAGFDAGLGDPLGGCCVTPAGFAQLTSMLMGLAGSKLVLVCEGGYNLRTISRSCAACLRVLRGEMPAPIARKLKAKQSATLDLLRTEIALSSHWSSFYRTNTFSPHALSLIGAGSATDAGNAPVNSNSEVFDDRSVPPHGSSLLSLEALNNSLQSGELLRSKVSVWWRGDKRWYTGVIHYIDSMADSFVVQYEDSEVTTETTDALVAVHGKTSSEARPNRRARSSRAASSASPTDTKRAASDRTCDEPCPCPGATKRERVKAWVQQNLGKPIQFQDGRKGVLLEPGRGYMRLQLNGEQRSTFARTRDLVVPTWVLSDTYDSKQSAEAAGSDRSTTRAQRHGPSNCQQKHAQRKIKAASRDEDSEESEGSDSSDSSADSERNEVEYGEEDTLNSYRYKNWLQSAVGKQVKLKDGRRGTLARSRTGFIEIVLKREGMIRVRRHEIILPRFIYQREGESTDSESGSATETDEDDADSNDSVDESSDQDSDDCNETINGYRYRQWLREMIGSELTFKDGRRGKLINSGAGFLRIRIKGAKKLVCARQHDINLPQFLFERDPARQLVVDEMQSDTAAATRKQPAKRHKDSGNAGKPRKRSRK